MKQVFKLLVIYLILILSGFSFAQTPEIIIQWAPNTDSDLSHYKMYRDTNSGTMVYHDEITQSSYTDTSVVIGQTYYYKVSAIDSAGNESGPSNEIMASVVSVTYHNNQEDQLIKNFELRQNYPNPFNPTTTIEYSIPNPSATKIIIYNALGQEVKVLYNGYKDTGTYSIVWGGTNNAGIKVSSGVYFYQMIAGNFSDIRKLVLQK